MAPKLWVICQKPQGNVVTASLSASWGGGITALLLTVVAVWQQSWGSHSPYGHREAEGCSPLSQEPSGSNCPPQWPVSITRGDNASGSKGGWTAPQVYPKSTSGLMGCCHCSLSSAKKKKKGMWGCSEVICRCSCAFHGLYWKKETFFS